MSDRLGPQVYSIAAHRGFADALVAGLLPRYSEDGLGLARLTLLLPSGRAIRTVSEAFVRRMGEDGGHQGLLLPRMVTIGDLSLDEALGPLLDPLGGGDGIRGVQMVGGGDPDGVGLVGSGDDDRGHRGPRGAARLPVLADARSPWRRRHRRRRRAEGLGGAG